MDLAADDRTTYMISYGAGLGAPTLVTTYPKANQTINVIVSHNGQEEDALDRQLQSEALAEIMRAADPEPFVFLGMTDDDVNRLVGNQELGVNCGC
jgi:hypothetical protein